MREARFAVVIAFPLDQQMKAILGGVIVGYINFDQFRSLDQGQAIEILDQFLVTLWMNVGVPVWADTQQIFKTIYGHAEVIA